MKTVLSVNDDYTLTPDKRSMGTLMRLVQPGVEVEASLSTERPRSLPQHRRYFARLGEFADSIPESTARVFWISVLRDLMMIQTIDVEIIHDLVKKVIGTDSIAFHKMTQDEAVDFFRQADELIDRWSAAMEVNTP